MAQGCTPPGEVLPIFRTTCVVSCFTPGAMDAEPFICTAPASSAGLPIVACQLLLRFTSLALTSSTGFGGSTLHAPSVSAAVRRAGDRCFIISPSPLTFNRFSIGVDVGHDTGRVDRIDSDPKHRI